MFFTGVAGNQIQQNPDPQRVGAAAQLRHILVGAVAGRNLLIVPDVVARILEGRVKAGIDPQGVAAETLHVGQLFGDAGKVADAVSVGVPEALRIYFIKYGVTKPGCRHNNSSVFCFCMDHPTNTGNCRDRGGWRAREDFGWFPVEIPRTSAAGSLSASGTGRIGKRQMYYRKKRRGNQEKTGKKSSREAHGRALPAAFPQDIGSFNNF